MAKKQEDKIVLDKVAENKEEEQVILKDFSTAKTIFLGHVDSYFPYCLKMYKNFYMYPVDRFENLVKTKEAWRTNIKSPLTHTYTMAVYNMVTQASIEFFVIDKNGDNDKLSEEMLTLVDYIKDKEEYIGQWESVTFDAVLLWTGIAASTFIDYTIKSEYMNAKWQKVPIEEVSQYPMMQYKSPFNYMRYGSQTNADKRFELERIIVPLNALPTMYPYLKISQKKLEEISTWADYISNFDFEAIKAYMPFYSHSTHTGLMWGDGNLWPSISTRFSEKGFRNILNDDTFDIKKAKQIEVLEVSNMYYVTVYANGVNLGTMPTQWPYKKSKYVTCAYKTSPWIFQWLGIGTVVAPLQDTFDAILNSRIDNVKLSVNQMYMMDSSMTLFWNKSSITTTPWGVIKVSNMDWLRPLQMNEVKNSAYEETNAMMGMVQGAVAIAAPMLGIQQKVERVAAWPEMLKTAADNQLAPLLRNMERFMGQMFKRFIILAKVYMSESEIDNILWEDNEFNKADLESIMKDYDYTFAISSPQLDLNQSRRMQLLELLKVAQDGIQAGNPTSLSVEKLTEAIIDSYSLPKDLKLKQEQVNEMMGNVDKTIGAVKKASGKAAEPSMEQVMRKAQWQWIPVPPDMTTNAWGANQFTEWALPEMPQI
jgi:hypothetical protein